jgi:hypothetical protein
MLVTLPNPIPELQHAPLPLKVLQARECAPTPYFSVIFSLDSHLSPLIPSSHMIYLGGLGI